MKIRAAVLDAPNRPFVIQEIDLDPPRAGEVLVRLAACGVCHSDWHVVTGDTKHPMPVVTGHEGAGIVEALGETAGDQGASTTPDRIAASSKLVKGSAELAVGACPELVVGDAVVLSWAPSCGSCFYCIRNAPNLCDTYTTPIWAGTMLDGTTRLSRSRGGKREPVYSYCGTAAFATHTVVPRQSCVKIRRDVPLESAALVGCAVATGVGAAIFTADVRPGDTVVVFGCGGVGLSVIQGCRLRGAERIFAVDTRVEKIPVALHFGATSVLMSSDDVASIVKCYTAGRGAEHVFEAIGSPAVQERALDCVRPGGTLTLAGLSPMGSATNFPAAIIARKEITIKGSYYGGVSPQRDFPMLLDLYSAGKLNLDDLITKRYELEQINEAFADMIAGKTARGVIAYA